MINIESFSKKTVKTYGGPINIVINGSEKTINDVFTNAGWSIADKLTLESKEKIILACIRNSSYPQAPVSTLYYMYRPQDIAYELEVGGSPRKRHHIRLWKSSKEESDMEIWTGAASFDDSIEFSWSAREFTHQINPNIDSERDTIVNLFKESGFQLEMIDFQIELEGVNGEGDHYYTDGKIALLHK